MQRKFSPQEKEAKPPKRGPSATGLAPLRFTLCLSLFAAVFLGCTSGGITLEGCPLGNDAMCPQGQVCKPTATTEPGRGVCVPEEMPQKVCTPGEAGSCPEGEVCHATTDGRGQCLPEGGPSLVCTPGGQGGCPSGRLCWDTSDGRGECMPQERCVPGGTGVRGCEEGRQCWDTTDTPVGQGTCVPDNTCTLAGGAECTEADELCWPTEGMPPGLGVCAPNTCIPEEDTCPNGLECLAPTGEEEGKCLPSDSCTLPDNTTWEERECTETGYACWKLSDASAELGRCIPEDSCTLPGNTTWQTKECSGAGNACWDTGETAELGVCLAEGDCFLASGIGCTDTDICLDTEGDDTFGTCYVHGSCRLGEAQEDCGAEMDCLSSINAPAEGIGTCVPTTCEAADDKCPPSWQCMEDNEENWACIPEACTKDEECPGEWTCSASGEEGICELAV